MQGDIEAYLREKQWGYRVEGGEVRLDRCPFCGGTSRRPFTIHPETGNAICHKCDWRGGLTLLKRSQGDVVTPISEAITATKISIVKPPRLLAEKYAKALQEDADKMAMFCSWRVLKESTVRKFKIGFCVEKGAFTYPFYESGELIAIKYKRLGHDGQKQVSRWKSDSKNTKTSSSLFGVDFLSGNERVVVTEGEDDCMVLSDAGVSNVVSLPNGCAHVSGKFLDALEPFRNIVICMDADESGTKGAENLRDLLGEDRSRIVEHPTGVMTPQDRYWKASEAKDATDYARANSVELLTNAIDKVSTGDNDRVVHIADFIEELRDDFLNGDRSRGRTTGFPSLDNLIGGRRPGELTVISGNTGSGKSSFTLNLALNIAASGEGVLLGSFEQTILAVLRKISQSISEKWFALREDETGSSMQIDDLDEVCRVLEELPLYAINVFGRMSTEEFVDCAAYAKRRLKVPTVILDHIHFMLRHSKSDTERIEIDHTMLALKQCTIENQLYRYVVAHPKKKNDENAVIGVEDFRGSSFISQVADNVLVVWRDRNIAQLDPSMGRAEIHSLKCRSECGSEGRVELGFSYAGQKFVDKLGKEISPLGSVQESFPEDFEDDF